MKLYTHKFCPIVMDALKRTRVFAKPLLIICNCDSFTSFVRERSYDRPVGKRGRGGIICCETLLANYCSIWSVTLNQPAKDKLWSEPLLVALEKKSESSSVTTRAIPVDRGSSFVHTGDPSSPCSHATSISSCCSVAGS